mgnify:CR=1 FL=1
MSQKIKRIGLLTSGGDSPGMNCAIRAIVRTAIYKGYEAYGIERGYAGLLDGSLKKMDVSSVGNIIQHGGTVLQTSRCPEFLKKEIRSEAIHILKRKKIDALIVIGGDGSFNAAWKLWEEHQFPVVGVPGTIDNDISATDYTIGFDSAVQTAVEAVDKIRDTASSHARTFIVEVMGRSSPSIALHVGVCTGAENVVLPSNSVDYKQIASDIKRGVERGKNSSIIIVAEGKTPGLSYKIQKNLKDKYTIPAHVCILGHIQRGGNPSPLDRFIASRMGHEAVHCLDRLEFPKVTSYVDGMVKPGDLEKCLEKRSESKPHHIDLVRTLSI